MMYLNGGKERGSGLDWGSRGKEKEKEKEKDRTKKLGSKPS